MIRNLFSLALQSLMESKQLEKNSFALLFPYNRQGIGDLSFGTSHPELHEGPFTSRSTWAD